MLYLVIASLIWCFSFGLIGNTLAELPRAWIAALRLLIAALIFLPCAKKVPTAAGVRLFGTGALQFGLMYLAYMYSFNHLQSHEVALFTIFTPVYVSLINDIQERRFNRRNLLSAALAVGGSAVILWNAQSRLTSFTGFVFVQISGICFGLGQLLYRRLYGERLSALQREDRHVMAWLYAGGFASLFPLAVIECMRQIPKPSGQQALTILYLGIMASGIAFFLWNKGARMVGAGTLAVMNNLKIPAGVLVSLLLFHETANLGSLLCGSCLIGAAIWAAGKK